MQQEKLHSLLQNIVNSFINSGLQIAHFYLSTFNKISFFREAVFFSFKLGTDLFLF